jgi:4-amino-4-deoxy-L-arabinose transferase-like glycosyltransferase
MTTITADVLPSAADDPATPPEPRWARPGLLALLAATAVLYLWGLGSSGWANSYYAAAAQAGTQDWKAWLFGSLDAGNAITVDKPPAAMWLMGLSGRLFGFNAFTMLLPQALMGVAAVAVLYFTVKRSSGPGAGLIAGAVLALTPVATLMFRYNNPDALLVLLLVVAAYCTVRAIENGSTRWMALTGCVVGFAFLTKMLQAFLVVPGLALAFLVAAPTGMWKRIGALLVGGATMILSAGWYIALVSLWPADSRVPPTTTFCNWRWATTESNASSVEVVTAAVLEAATALVVAEAAEATCSSVASPASAGCSARRSAPRPPGCCPRRSSVCWPASGSRGAPRAQVEFGPACCCGVAGCW